MIAAKFAERKDGKEKKRKEKERKSHLPLRCTHIDGSETRPPM
jgi:hypothetical protein